MDCKNSGRASINSSLAAPRTTPTMTPASSRRSVCCTPLASSSVNNTPATAPAKAPKVTPSFAINSVASGDTPNNTRLRATPSEAPEALPNRYGSASGLRNRPWATAPAKPSKAPATQAPSVRGRRMSHTICHATGSLTARNTLSNPVLPTPAPNTSKAMASASNISATALARWFIMAWRPPALCRPGNAP